MKPGLRIQLVAAPPDFGDAVGTMPEGIKLVTRGDLGFAMVFARRKADLRKWFPRLRDRLMSNGMLWVAWPKKASGVETDLTESIVRSIGLDAGLVDVKVCAIDHTWSGLKFVRRLKDR